MREQWVKAVDCRDALADLIARDCREVSLVVTDPPYFMGIIYLTTGNDGTTYGC